MYGFFPFSFSRSPCSVPGSWSPFLVSRSPFFLLPSPLPLLCSPFLRFPVSCSSFSASLSPRSSFFVILFFYKIVNNEAIVHNFFRMKKQSKVRTSRCLHVLTDGSGRVKTNDSITLWFQQQNFIFSPVYVKVYFSGKRVMFLAQERAFTGVFS